MHKFKAKKGYKFSGPCTVCGYTSTTEEQHGHSCTGKIIREQNIFDSTYAYCYECGKKYTYSGVKAYVKAR